MRKEGKKPGREVKSRKREGISNRDKKEKEKENKGK